jgi:hypothetical protein
VFKNFYYAAYSYLNEWMWKDSHFHSVLAHGGGKTEKEDGEGCLFEVAVYYRVIRTLRLRGDEPRLQAAYRALSETQLPNGDDPSELVSDFASTLRREYGGFPLSASSKFLWMRFRSPIVIFDQFVSKHLHRQCKFKTGDYADFYKIWINEFHENEHRIREACAELNGIKKFTRADELSNDDLLALTSSRWFAERVFDHFAQESGRPENSKTWA